jgi:hypothetical protein
VDEVEVWRWSFVDEFGKRVKSSWPMDADRAARYKDAVRIPGTMEIRRPAPSTSDLSALAAHTTSGNFFESPWQFVRFGQLQRVSDEDAVRTLAAWCKRQAFEMSFVTRRAGSVHTVC